jgi:uncharacterized protein (TIGR02001 family)
VPAPHRLALSLAAALAFCLSSPARAQLGFSVSADSDYRFRGVSLSDGKPDVNLNVTYDNRSGFYAGATAIGAESAHGGAHILAYLEYIGFSAPISGNIAWDAGVSNSTVSQRPYNPYNIDYVEAFAGVVTRDFNVHVYYSPNYIGEGFDAVYLDLNGAVRPRQGWRVFAHAGVLTPLGVGGEPGSRREHYDLRVGVAAAFANTEVQLAWTTTSPGFNYPPGVRQRRDAVVVGASYFF